jgi:hypothetical protein
MGNPPKEPNQRQDPKKWDDEGGAPRSGHRFNEPHAEPELYYFNIKTPIGLIEDPEGDIYANPQAAREAALAVGLGLIAEGDRAGEDRRDWRFEIMDRSNQHVLTVRFAEVSDQTIGDSEAGSS